MAVDGSDDPRAVERVLGGDPEAFRGVVVRHSPGLFAYVGSLLGVGTRILGVVVNAVASRRRGYGYQGYEYYGYYHYGRALEAQPNNRTAAEEDQAEAA